jgi:hypothetical protein
MLPVPIEEEGGWEGPVDSLDVLEKKKKNFLPQPGYEPGIVQSVA